MSEFVTYMETDKGKKKIDFQSLGNFPVCEVGQVMRVTAVDENGAPTAWEAADHPTVYMTQVTLSASGWDADALTQSVAVSGILADDTKQLVQAVPAPASMAAATEAGAYCSGQGADSLTFTCTSVPAEDIVFNVSYQDATFVS